MAAKIRLLTDKEWYVLRGLLSDLGEGGIVIPPGAQKALKAEGIDLDMCPMTIDDYDFDGNADVWIDVASDDNGHYVNQALIDHVRASSPTEDEAP